MSKLPCFLLKKGAGAPCVFLHGFLGTHADWEEVLSYLSGICCLAIDLPGHGGAVSQEPFLIPVSPPFHLVGYSLGGRLAMDYAQRYPDHILSLTLCSAHPGLRCPQERKRRWQEDLQWADYLLNHPIDEFLKRWYDRPLFGSYVPDWNRRRLQNPKLLAQTLLQFSLAKQPVFSFPDALQLIGEKDEKFKTLYPNYTLIPQASHAIHLENPKAVAFHLQQRIFYASLERSFK